MSATVRPTKAEVELEEVREEFERLLRSSIPWRGSPRDMATDALALLGEEVARRFVEELVERLPPAKLELDCDACGAHHVDEREWEARPHRTHLCASCGHEWSPRPYRTVGVRR